MEGKKYVPHVMIDADGKAFMKSELDKIIQSSPCFSIPASAIKVVSVIGAQNSGKSTLMNSLFGCRFEVMDAEEGIQQTTKGIWASECTIPNLVVLDVEGSDGKERARGDVSFERKSALFALTVSNVMIFNTWAKDVGRNEGGSVPLFAMIFQERVKLEEGQTRLLVVLRGYDGKTPFDKLEKKIMSSMKETWDEVNNPAGQENIVPFSSYIDKLCRTQKSFIEDVEVKVVTLADAVLQEEKFENEVAKLRGWFCKDAFVGFQQHKVTAAVFSFSAHELWKQIQQNKQLDLPTHREMVSGHFCGEVKRKCLTLLDYDEDYLSLGSNMIESPQEFNDKLESLIKRLTGRYEVETKTYNERAQGEKKKELIDEIIRITSTYSSNLVTKLRDMICYEALKLILDGIVDDPTTEVYELAENCVYDYIARCQVLLRRYPTLLPQNMINDLKFHLVNQGKLIKENYKREMAMHEQLERARLEAEKRKQEAERTILEYNQKIAGEKAETQRQKHELEIARLQVEKEAAVAEAERYRCEAEEAKLRAMRPSFGRIVGNVVGLIARVVTFGTVVTFAN